ncbi:MAG: carbohydrate-binding protein [Dysgonamonadaceae bacterium]|jgi:predicted alpha-1,6-mannanase (GH76 family)|nr:carbohydrate-binding protein [Dysgonamonadaceae bacterium]
MKRILFIFNIASCISYYAVAPVAGEITAGQALKINSCTDGARSLSTPHSSLEEGAELVAWPETNVPAQRWIADTAGENRFYLTNAYSGLQLAGASNRPNAKPIQKSNENAYNKWEFIPVENPAFPNAYFIRLSTTAHLIELTDNLDGSPLKLQTKRTDADSLRQMWTVTTTDLLPNRITPTLRDSVMHAWKTLFFNALKTSTGFWGEAEMMETILDAYETTGKEDYKTMFEEVYAHFVGTPSGWTQPGNGQDWQWNEYNDDIAWAVLASVRAYLMFGTHSNSNINYLTIAKNNYDRMYSRALQPAGTLRWNQNTSGDTGTNSCINGPAEVAACYLAIATGDDSYYEKAKNLYAKQRQALYDSSTGDVYDNGSWNVDGTQFTTGSRWVSTYNQGTFLGAALMLYKRYGTEQYKNDAHKIAERTRSTLCNARGVLNGEGSTGSGGSDREGFKGILMRYLRRYIVDLALPDKAEWMQRNALQSYNNRNAAGVCWTEWQEKSTDNFTCKGEDKRTHMFGYSTAVSAAFNAPLSAALIIKNAFENIEAENFDYLKGIFVERTDDTTAVVGNTGNNYYTTYSNVDFGSEEAGSVELLALGGSRPASVEVRRDSLSGRLLTTVQVPAASGGNWVTLTSPVEITGGRHNIYLVYKGVGFKIDHFRFLKKSTGIEKIAPSPSIELYPNPANSRLFVKSPHSGELSIYDVDGTRILLSAISAGTTELDISTCMPGIYFVGINTVIGIFSSKFAKK